MATTPRNPQNQSKSEFESDASGLKRTLKGEANEAGSAMHDARDAVSGKASEFASEAREGVMREAEGAKRHASESLRTFADTIREAGDKLSQSDQGVAAGFVRQAASGLERLSTSLSDKPLGEMVEDVRSFGRRNPAAFVAGSVLAGMALGRFVRSSANDGNGHGHDMNSPRGTAASSSYRPSTASGTRASSSPIGSGRGMRGAADSAGGISSGTAVGSTPTASSASPAGSSGIADQTKDLSGSSNRTGSGSSGSTGRAK